MANEKNDKNKKDAKNDGPPKEKKEKKEKKSGGKRQATQAAAPKEHTGVGQPAPEPRLRVYYAKTVRDNLAKQFGLKNVHEIPNLEKIVLNVGMSEAIKQPKVLDAVVNELGIITGQRPVKKKAKKSIANYGLRQGQEIGVAVTLRGAKMWEFFDRFVSVAVPRIRDFKGMSTKSFDGRGNYSLGIKEQMIFPEINYDDIEQIHGMDITFVTSVDRDDQAHALLKELGMPFRTDEKGKKTVG